MQETLDPHVSKKGHSSGRPRTGRRLRGALDPQLVSQSEHTCRKTEQDCNNADTGYNCRALKIPTQSPRNLEFLLWLTPKWTLY